jgi:hypothetical protein
MTNVARSPTPDSDSVVSSQHKVTIASQLTHHTVVPAKQGTKGKAKDKKEVKTKELSHTFSPTSENYLVLLKAVLAKHGEEKYNVTDKKRYIFKVLCPPAKAFVLVNCIYAGTKLIFDSGILSGNVMLLTSKILLNSKSWLRISSSENLTKSRCI